MAIRVSLLLLVRQLLSCYAYFLLTLQCNLPTSFNQDSSTWLLSSFYLEYKSSTYFRRVLLMILGVSISSSYFVFFHSRLRSYLPANYICIFLHIFLQWEGSKVICVWHAGNTESLKKDYPWASHLPRHNDLCCSLENRSHCWRKDLVVERTWLTLRPTALRTTKVWWKRCTSQ